MYKIYTIFTYFHGKYEYFIFDVQCFFNAVTDNFQSYSYDIKIIYIKKNCTPTIFYILNLINLALSLIP